MINDSFKNKIQNESSQFKYLMKILTKYNSNSNRGRKLLNLIDQIIDYYVINENDDDHHNLRMPVIFFPVCEDWAQKLCEEFVALKMSLLWNPTTINAITNKFNRRPYLEIPTGLRANTARCEGYEKQYQLRKYIAQKTPKDIEYLYPQDDARCLIYSRYLLDQRERCINTRTYYHFVKDLLSSKILDNLNSPLCDSESSLSLLGNDEDRLYDILSKDNGSIKIPNIIIFPQKEMDGKNADLALRVLGNANSYNEDFKTDIKNVFFFIFSQKPYHLQHILDIKLDFSKSSHDFISFTKEESDFLFDRHHSKEIKCFIDNEPCVNSIKQVFDFLLEDVPHEVKLRNELAISFTDNSRNEILRDIMIINPEANEDYIRYYLNALDNVFSNSVENNLIEWIDGQKIGIVLDYNIDDFYKRELKIFLSDICNASEIEFYTYKDLKPHKSDSTYQNTIRTNKILLLSILNHCTGKSWAIYPNSFDQLCLNKDQEIFILINKFVFEPRFSWYLYRYIEQMGLILSSDFRNSYLNSPISLPDRPAAVYEPKEDDDEQDIISRQVGYEQQRFRVVFSDGQRTRTLFPDDLILCDFDDNYEVRSIADIESFYGKKPNFKIQVLDEFYQELSNFIDNPMRNEVSAEELFRRNPRYKLSKEEIESNIEMWKILLQRKVSVKGEENVYKEIMEPLQKHERISLTSFQKWLNIEDSSILPRNRRLQRRVIEDYLEIDRLYITHLRHKKSKLCTDTEGQNRIFRTFLSFCLTESDNEKVYNQLSVEIKDYLNIENSEDVEAYSELIKENLINFREVESIEICN